MALVMVTPAGAMAAPMDADRDGLSGGQEVRLTETKHNDAADSNNGGVRDINEDEDRDSVDNTDDGVLFGTATMDDEIEDGAENEDD